jgi:flagellar biogenesis protein FliO
LTFDASTLSAPIKEGAREAPMVTAAAPVKEVSAETNEVKAQAQAQEVPAAGEMKTFPWAARKEKGKAPSPFKPAFSSRQSSMAASGMVGILVLGLLTVFWATRRKKTLQADVGSIEVVAVQSLGGKHKLALVQTCGERLLLATSDKEVRLLSHVGNTLIDESNFSDPSLSESRIKEWGNLVKQVETPVTQEQAPEPFEKPVMPRGTVGGNVGFAGTQHLSSDLEGLIRLRKKQSGPQNETAEISATASAILNPLTEQYRRDGAAA